MQQKISMGEGYAPNPSARVQYDNIAMQLAAITYCSVESHSSKVNNKSVALTLGRYLPDWELVWAAQEAISGNYAFIVCSNNQYVVAIRGSILNFSFASFDNWFKEDFNVLEQVPWTFPANSYTNPMISQGSSNGLTALSQLTGTNGDTMLDFLYTNATPANASISITGHSLGGNLATVFGPWLYYQLQQMGATPPASLPIFTFAAPASFNASFNSIVSTLPFLLFRYYNVLDIVPLGANRVANMTSLFPNYPASASSLLTDVLLGVSTLILGWEWHYSSYYAQPTNGIALNTRQQEYPVTSTDPVAQWFEQASAQHDHNHYLDWLQTPQVNCVKKGE